MTTIDCRATTSAPNAFTKRAIANFATRTVEKVATFIQAFKNRRAMYQLGVLSDIELADIGLRRSDLFVALESPATVDPAIRLSRLAAGNIREAAARYVN